MLQNSEKVSSIITSQQILLTADNPDGKNDRLADLSNSQAAF